MALNEKQVQQLNKNSVAAKMGANIQKKVQAAPAPRPSTTGGKVSPVNTTSRTSQPSNTVTPNRNPSPSNKTVVNANDTSSDRTYAYSELGRSQAAYDEYMAAGRPDLANLAHKYANEVRSKYGITGDDGVDYKAYFDRSDSLTGSAGKYAIDKSGVENKLSDEQIMMLSQLRNVSDSQYDATMATHEATKSARIAEIEKAYNAAVEEGRMSIREAQEAYRQQVDAINQQAYDDQQVTNLNAASRGISNSQQLLGMQASDQARANTNRTNAQINRDNAIANLKQRIATLTANRGVDVANANMQYDMAEVGAASQRDATYAQNAFNLQLGDYEAERDFRYDTQMLNQQTAAQVELMEKQYGIDLERMKAQLGIDKELGAFMNDLDIMKLGVQHNFNLEAMRVDASLQDQLNAAQASRQASLQRSSQAAAAQASVDEYQQALQREMAKYTPGTPEYALAQAELKAYNEQTRSNALNEARTEYEVKQIMENPNLDVSGQIKAPTLKNGKYSEKELTKYNSQVSAWNAYVDLTGAGAKKSFLTQPASSSTSGSTVEGAPSWAEAWYRSNGYR